MKASDTTGKLLEFRNQVLQIQQLGFSYSIPHEEVEDYQFQIPYGQIRLSQLFDKQRYLLMAHTMGNACNHCTDWAHGFNSVLPHLKKLGAFVVTSPDSPAAQRTQLKQHGWKFPMVSHLDTSFAQDMGYKRESGWWPGVSVFKMEGYRIIRVSDTDFGPLDDFCLYCHAHELVADASGF